MVVHTFKSSPQVPLCESEVHGTYIESSRIVIRILENASLRDPEQKPEGITLRNMAWD